MSEPQPPDFDEMYTRDTDPWRVASSWYERRKRAVLLASLPRERYASGWEPGCGIGETTLALAHRCGTLLATDSSPVAVDLARTRLEERPEVTVLVSALPELPAQGPFDLLVAAEFLYYLPDLAGSVDALWSVAAPGAHLVVEHWAHRPDDGFLSGPETQETVARTAAERGARRLVRHEDADFRLDVFELPT